jgi:xanthine dehydrogenase YagS FAD-binding subunit
MGRIEANRRGLRLGGLARMAEAADHPGIRRGYPMIAQSLALAASPQIRNMASLAGNVLQRTRCPYFRDVSYAECSKRNPGTGCAAMDGHNRMHAVLGTSNHCIATYPGDFAQALIALDAMVDIVGARGGRRIPFADLHRRPGRTPDVETTLSPGDVIVSFFIPAAPCARRSVYLKIRDRESYEFALVSAAVALDLRQGRVHDARIALGGVATVPWRATSAEVALKGKAIDERTMAKAAKAAFAGARRREHNAFKIALGRRVLIRALGEAAAMEL